MHTTTTGQPITSDEIYVVSPDGQHSRDNGTYLFTRCLFIEPDHLWRGEWSTETPGVLKLSREDYIDTYSGTWLSEPGLIGIFNQTSGSNIVLETVQQLRAAAAAVTRQLTRQINRQLNHSDDRTGGWAAVDIPRGTAIHIVPPRKVFGTTAAWNERVAPLPTT